MFLQSYSIPVKDVMSSDFFKMNREENLDVAVEHLLHNIKKEIIVYDEDNICGIVTMSDIKKVMGQDFSKVSLDRIMSRDIISVDSNECIFNCRSIMIKNNIRRLLVLENGVIVGILREEHIGDYFYKGVEEAELAIKHIFDNIHEAVCVVDSKGRIVIWNKNAEKLYGFSETELKGKPLEKYFPNAMDLKVSDTKEGVKNIYHSPKEGYHVIISASPIIIDGKLYGVVSTEKDISEVEELQNELNKARQQLEILERQIKGYAQEPFKRIIGSSNKIQEKINISKQIAPSNVSVLITGESGTGKEEFARAIHFCSGLSGNFVPVNCSAIPYELFESEFFGYTRGAFTGANREGKSGFFELANEGTLFLDEIGDLPLSMQGKLLRVLQDKKIRKVGGEKYIPLNVRIISATNKDLLEMVKEETFREDLFYRINVVEIKLPPLRERKEDIVPLVDYFLKEFCKENNKPLPKIESNVVEILVENEWKGNIRELKNVVEHMAIMCNNGVISLEHLPKYIIKRDFSDFYNYNVDGFDLNKSLAKFELNIIKKALEISNGNKKEASILLNIPRTTLHSKLKKYGMDN